MANKHNTDLIVRAITEGFDKVATDINKVGGSVDKAADSASKGKTKWTELQSALQLVETGYRYVATAAREVMEAIQRGAELDTIRRKFDNLAVSFGTTGDELRGRLHDGIGLLLSDANQMGLALDLMQLGLAKNTDEVVRFASVMSEMGMDTGEVVLAIANQSTMRLDQLGIGLSAFKENLAAVKEEGYSTDAAFSEAFLRTAEETIGTIGGVAGTTAGDLAVMTSVWENTKDSFSESFAEGVIDQLGGVVDGADGASAAMVAFASEAGAAMATILRPIMGVMLAILDLRAAIAGARLEVAQFVANLPNISVFGAEVFNSNMIEGAQASLGTLTDELIQADIRSQDFAAAIYGSEAAVSEFQSTASDVVPAVKELKEVTEDNSDVQILAAKNIKAQQEAMHMANLKVQAAIDANKGLGGSSRGAAADVDELAKAMEELSSATGSYFMQARNSKDFNPVEALLDSMERLGASAGMLAEAGVAGGLFSQDEANQFMAEAATRGKADQLAQMVMGGMDPAQAAQMVQGIGEQMEGNAELAQGFFDSIAQDPKEATLSMDTALAQQQLDAFFGANQTMDVQVSVSGLPSTGKDPVEREIEALGGG